VGQHLHGVHAAGRRPVADIAGRAGSIVNAAGKLLHGQGGRELGLTHSQRYKESLKTKNIGKKI
jgi:hypothetical protein